MQRQFPQIVAIQRQDIERVELNLVIMPAGVQTVEIGDAVDAQQHRLAIDDERSRSVLQRGHDDQRITISPVGSVADEQPHAFTFALNDQAKAIVLDFVEPCRRGRNLFSRCREARFERCSTHAG